jgi:1-acyl-sn-glycerol-3-phosphate acyltransferase
MILRKIANMIIDIAGWKVSGEIPQVDKAVYIAAPHTSNWDGFWMIVGKIALGVEAQFLAKHTLFWWPLGNVLKCIGAMPIDRSRGAGVVEQLIAVFENNERFYLALAPEGTRKRVPYWKTGFYRIAVEADVPIVVAFIDYAGKKMGIGELFMPTGDPETDLQYLLNFYAPFTPRRPENMGPIAFPP